MRDGEQRARRLVVIYNPTAGMRAQRRVRAMVTALNELGAVTTLSETRARGHAQELAHAAVSADCDAIVAAGGDGTINEIANGLAGAPLPLAILPLGTANVLAAEIGLPRRVGALAQLAAFGPVREVWPGEVVTPGAASGRLFLLMAGVGFDASVIEHLDLGLKRRIGKGAYAASIFGRVVRYRRTSYDVLVDGEPASPPASLVAARAHFYGGRYILAPAASLEAHRLDVVMFKRSGRRAVLDYLAAMGVGRLAQRKDIRIVAADCVDIAGPLGAPVHVDGDICARLPVTIRLAERPLFLIAPAI